MHQTCARRYIPSTHRNADVGLPQKHTEPIFTSRIRNPDITRVGQGVVGLCRVTAERDRAGRKAGSGSAAGQEGGEAERERNNAAQSVQLEADLPVRPNDEENHPGELFGSINVFNPG